MRHTLKEIWDIIPMRLQGAVFMYGVMLPLMISDELGLTRLEGNIGFWIGILTVTYIVSVMVSSFKWVSQETRDKWKL